jgi:hypothetical protein
MAEELRRISFDDFARNLARFFELVIHEHEAVVVENAAGEGVVIQPLPTATRVLSDEDFRAFRSAFGGWADVDTDSLKDAIYESRQLSTRPPVTL